MTTHICEHSGIEFETKDGWVLFGIKKPLYDKPVLTTNGYAYEIRILRFKDHINYWESLSIAGYPHFNVTHWMPLPKLPQEN